MEVALVCREKRGTIDQEVRLERILMQYEVSAVLAHKTLSGMLLLFAALKP